MGRPRKTDQLFHKRDLTPEDASEILARHIKLLAETFDNVVVLASRQNVDGSTQAFVQREGNAYALKAQMEEYAGVILSVPEEEEHEGEN